MSQEQFQQVFSNAPEVELFAAGRVNLIGEHIDYCGGLVMPMAINRGTRGWVRRIEQPEVQIYSARFNEKVTIPLKTGSARNHWSDFVVGVASLLPDRLLQAGRELDQVGDSTRTFPTSLSGMQVYVSDDIDGGGLSSSASFSLLICHALLWAAGRPVTSDADQLVLARLCQQVEHDFIGVNCGIMDQASIALGGIVLLNCKNLAFKRVDSLGDQHRIVVMDTCHPRTLAGSKYNERVKEIAAIQTQLKSSVEVSELCELNVHQLPELLDRLDSPTLVRRLRHVVSENARVQQAQVCLAKRDMNHLGDLLNQSHESLKVDYEVTGDALDSIVAFSQSQAGCIGARMTGAGFGGCAIALVEVDKVQAHNAAVASLFQKQTGVESKVFTVEAAAPAGLLEV